MSAMIIREDVFTTAHRKDMLKKFKARAERLFLADLTDSELANLAFDMRTDITSVTVGRGFQKKGKWSR